MTSRFFYILRALLFRVSSIANILALRCAYAKTLRDVRGRIKGRKVRVLFPVNEIAKWKLQTVYDLMVQSGKFDPLIAVTISDSSWQLSSNEIAEKLEQIEDFFAKRNMVVVWAYDLMLRKTKDFKLFSPDIVFYGQPWGYADNQMPAAVAIYALTCYVPYFVANYGFAQMDIMPAFQRQVWRHFVLSKSWEKEYGRYVHFWSYAGKLSGLGHPQLDYYYLHKDEFEDSNIVIYAPHWSISTADYETMENYSTFLHTNRIILDYAKAHREFRWVFKPHPQLKIALIESGAWNDKQVREYWSEWESIGTGCYTCEYPALFVKSRALITDCGSFLSEYFATGKPLIHLISSTRKITPVPAAKQYFDTFYQIHNERELLEILSRVLEKGDDWRRRERLTMLNRIGLQGNYAAKRILDYINNTLRL